MESKQFGLSTFQLKIIAIVTMFIDHFGYVFYTRLGGAYIWCRIIGRIAFPIFCFLLVQGLIHTHSRAAYALRLGLFCIVSEPFFDRAFHYIWFYPDGQNVFFTLLIGFCVIWIMDALWSRRLNNPFLDAVKNVVPIIVLIGACILAQSLHTDYGYKGVLFIAGFYCFRKNPMAMLVFFVLANMITADGRLENVIARVMSPDGFQNLGSYILSVVKPASQDAALLAIFPILLYNGKKGRSMKWFFYVFYPAHLLLLIVIYGALFG